jgi:hypothetical protein
MREKSDRPETGERHVRDIRRATRRKWSSEEKIRIVLSGLRGEYSIAELCRREGIADGLYYTWSKEFLGGACDRGVVGALETGMTRAFPNSVARSLEAAIPT